MLARFFVMLNSFLVVCAGYLVYGWVVVPLVLPPITPVERPASTSWIDEERKEFVPLFPAEAWERTTELLKILSNDEMIVLYETREELPENIIKISPCTILRLGGDATMSREERLRQSVMIRTPEYALLELDGPLGLEGGGSTKIQRGELVGTVTITSDMKEPGPEDDLRVVSKNVVITEKPALTTIRTFSAVDFRLAENEGRGEMLTIEMAQENPSKPDSPKTLSKVELLTLHELTLNAGMKLDDALADSTPKPKVGAQAGDKANAKDTAKTATATAADDAVIRIRCKQDFLLYPDPENAKQNNAKQADGKNPKAPPAEKSRKWIARFRDDVYVTCTHADGTVDTLECGELLVFLAPKAPVAESGGAKAKPPQKSDTNKDVGENPLAGLELTHMLAKWSPAKPAEAGKPALPVRFAQLRSPDRNDLHLIGEQILYDIRAGRFRLSKTRPELPPVHLSLHGGSSTVDAEHLTYQARKDGAFGVLTGSKGVLRGSTGSENDRKKLSCSWEALDLRPDPREPKQLKVTLSRNVNIDMETFGRMKADTAMIWLDQRPKKKETKETGGSSGANAAGMNDNGKPAMENVDLIPNRAQALGNVVFESDDGTATVKQLDVEFVEVAEDGTLLSGAPETILRSVLPGMVPRLSQAPEPSISSTGIVRADWTVPQGFSQGLRTGSQNAQRLRDPDLLAAPSVIRQVQLTVPDTPVDATPMRPLVQETLPPPQRSERGFLGSRDGATKKSVFHLTGEQMAMRVRFHVKDKTPADSASPNSVNPMNSTNPTTPQNECPRETVMERISVSGDVMLRETMLGGDASQAITITGRAIHAWEPGTEKMELRIAGETSRPAIFRGQGVEMTGSNININRATNLLWVDGVGQLTAQVSDSDRNSPLSGLSSPGAMSKPSGGPSQGTGLFAVGPAAGPAAGPTMAKSETPRELRVRWNKRMYFNGELLRFEGTRDIQNAGVTVLYHDTYRLFAENVSINLNRFFSFFDTLEQQPIAAETLEASGPLVSAHCEERDETGQILSRNDVECTRIRFHVPTTEFELQGSGRLRRVFPQGSGDDDFALKFGGDSHSGSLETAGETDRQTGANDRDGLMLLDIEFHDRVVGNQLHRYADLLGQILCIYHPMNDWSEKVHTTNLTEVSKRGMYMRCNTLQVVQMFEPFSSVEIVASGNTSVAGQGYYAKGETFKYNQAKDLIILEGNGSTSKAQITMRKSNGQTMNTSAQWLGYNLKTGAINTQGLGPNSFTF